MKRQSVESEAVLSVGYAEQARTLEVEFASGGVYQYLDVPPEVYRQLLAAESIGQFVAWQIKEVYPYRRTG